MVMQKSKKGRMDREGKYNIVVTLPELHAGLNLSLDIFLSGASWDTSREAEFEVGSFLCGFIKTQIPTLF